MSLASYTRWLTLLTMCTLWLFVGVGSVQAASDGAATRSTEAIVRERSTTIPSTQRVEDVLVLGHDVTVEGEVSEILMVLDGNVHLGAHSQSGIVLDFGGTVTQATGAHVRAIYHLRLNTPFWNGTLFGVVLAAFLWAGLLAVLVSLVVLASLLSFLLRKEPTPLGTRDASVRRVGLIGLLVSLLWGAVVGILSVTIVGIPVAVGLLVIYAMVGVIGFAMTSEWMGGLVLRNGNQQRPAHIQALIGAIVLTAFMSVPFVGLVLFVLVWILSVGASTLWVAGRWKARRRHRAPNALG